MDTPRETEGGAGNPPLAGASEKTQYELRQELLEMARRDLVGPAGGEHEEIDEDGTRVSVRYLMGMLAPRHLSESDEATDEEGGDPQSASADQPDELGGLEGNSPEEGSEELSPALASTMFSSSFGMSFCVDAGAQAIRLKVQWGHYDREDSETILTETGKGKRVWRRRPVSGSTVLHMAAGAVEAWTVDPEFPEVQVRGTIRQKDAAWVVTLFLVNGQREQSRNKDQSWLFQPKLTVEAMDGSAVFVKRTNPLAAANRAPESIREELQELAMLYRRKVEFARGHGVSVHATVSPEDSERCLRIETEVMPVHEVPLTETPTAADNPDLAEVVLDMKLLAEAGSEELAGMLEQLASAYERWIERENVALHDAAGDLMDYREIAERNVRKCSRALDRIREGIALLRRDDRVADAFRFANRVMWQQRIHSIYSQLRRQGKPTDLAEIDVPKNRSWRAFQLAFMLLSLASTADPQHPDRSHASEAIADVIWFPTGGGKTEAYLGLAAFAMAHRRLVGEIGGHDGSDGLCVLMRYTLRLLTIQQFQRATALICACEVERRNDEAKWGTAPFRIGLWVGGKSTPNRTEDADKYITKIRAKGPRPVGVGNPAQLTSCPWCGHEIRDDRDIEVESGDKTRNRTVIYCGDKHGLCEFSRRQSKDEGIPAMVVDEEIYRNPPSLLVATVDKFAQMPWNGRVAILFGRVTNRCPRHGYLCNDISGCNYHKATSTLPEVKLQKCKPLRPPDLIIQDELHLINGPLGSMVGLYETAIDELCSWELDGRRVRPKVVASSATIRRAREQVKRLYLREVEIFPPQGTDIRDNFFAVQREPSPQKPGRLYFGASASGRKQSVALIRLYATLMGAAKKLFETYGEKVDPWMTTVGYFNSLREMGGTRRLVEDDISLRLRRASERGLGNRRLPLALEELTSRRSSDAIPKILDRLELPHLPDDKRATGDDRPLDVVLATNMISVGVDVSRLGLMIATSQPKTTAEYIQATSRVGRAAPGIVCTAYNWSRPRDISHYESFEHFHATFYGHVEALSVTPFAVRALDRGLAGILTAMVRLESVDLNGNEAAGDIKSEHDFLHEIASRIIQRIEMVMGAGDSVLDELKQMLQRKQTHWLNQAEKHEENGLQYRQTGSKAGLLQQTEPGGWKEFTCLNSLRDVEPNVSLLLIQENEEAVSE